MKQYIVNWGLYLRGFAKLTTLAYRGAWTWWKYAPVYVFDTGLNVVSGGAVCTVSRRAQDHRSGWVWDKLLDIIETFDKDHGAVAGPPLWGSQECSAPVQWILGAVTLYAVAKLGIAAVSWSAAGLLVLAASLFA